MKRKSDIRPPDAEHMLESALSALFAEARKGTGRARVRLPERWDRCLALLDRNTRLYSASEMKESVGEHSLYKNRGSEGRE